jgi:hypothetical protein
MADPPSIWLFVIIAVVCTTVAATISSETMRRFSRKMVSGFRSKLTSTRNETVDLKYDESQVTLGSTVSDL